MKTAFLTLFLFTFVAGAATYCVGPAATGSGNGADWNNLKDWADTEVRGDTWILKGGVTYAGKVFNTAKSGSTLITIQLATSAAHVTETGWSSSFTNTADFTGTLNFNDTGYYVLDGMWSTAPLGTNCGFRVTGADNNVRFGGSVAEDPGSDNITVRCIKVLQSADVTSAADAFEIYYSSTNITITRCVADNINNCFMQSVSGNGHTVEYCYLGTTAGRADPNPHAETWAFDYSENMIFRYNLVTDVHSTGGLMINGNYAAIYGNIWHCRSSNWTSSSGIIGGWDTFPFTQVSVTNNTFININDQSHDTLKSILANVTGGSSTGNVIRNNLFYNCANYGASDDWATKANNHFASSLDGTFGTGATTSSGDPFVNLQAGDYELAVNLTDVALFTDMFGNIGSEPGAIQPSAVIPIVLTVSQTASFGTAFIRP